MLSVTRKDIQTTIDRLLGNTTTESVLRLLREEITLRRRRKAVQPGVTGPARDLVEILTGRGVTGNVLRRLRLATSKAARTR
ncbi:MAG: hypothetical protein ACXW2Q_01955 [Thermoanaerobaculia bacterium]